MLSTTGPRGWVIAALTARAKASGSSPGERTSHAHLATGSAMPTSSPPRKGSPGSIDCHCCPTVTSTGTRPRAAFRIPDIAFARPGCTWTFATASPPVACAHPSAIPITAVSWSPRT